MTDDAVAHLRERIAALESLVARLHSQMAEESVLTRSRAERNTAHISNLLEVSDRGEVNLENLKAAVGLLAERVQTLEVGAATTAATERSRAAVVTELYDLFLEIIMSGGEINAHEHLDLFVRMRDMAASVAKPLDG